MSENQTRNNGDATLATTSRRTVKGKQRPKRTSSVPTRLEIDGDSNKTVISRQTSDAGDNNEMFNVQVKILEAIENLTKQFSSKQSDAKSKEMTKPREVVPLQATNVVINTTLPPKFNPATKNSFQAWLKNFESISKLNQWDEEKMLDHLPLALEGNARRFLDVNDPFDTWQDAKNELTKRFDSRDSLVILRKIRELNRWRNETLLDFYDRAVELIQKYDGYMDDQMKYESITNGLETKHKIKLQCKGTIFDDLRDELQNLQKAEDIYENENRERRFPSRRFERNDDDRQQKTKSDWSKNYADSSQK